MYGIVTIHYWQQKEMLVISESFKGIIFDELAYIQNNGNEFLLSLNSMKILLSMVISPIL